jgi:hypothetical protein
MTKIMWLSLKSFSVLSEHKNSHVSTHVCICFIFKLKIYTFPLFFLTFIILVLKQIIYYIEKQFVLLVALFYYNNGLAITNTVYNVQPRKV